MLTEQYPALTEFLTICLWDADDKSSRRVPGTLLICWAEGRWTASLHDRDGGSRYAWVSATSWTGLMEALEKGLRGDDLPWRRESKKK